jgi:hypothetical protein
MPSLWSRRRPLGGEGHNRAELDRRDGLHREPAATAEKLHAGQGLHSPRVSSAISSRIKAAMVSCSAGLHFRSWSIACSRSVVIGRVLAKNRMGWIRKPSSIKEDQPGKLGTGVSFGNSLPSAIPHGPAGQPSRRPRQAVARRAWPSAVSASAASYSSVGMKSMSP